MLSSLSPPSLGSPSPPSPSLQRLGQLWCWQYDSHVCVSSSHTFLDSHVCIFLRTHTYTNIHSRVMYTYYLFVDVSWMWLFLSKHTQQQKKKIIIKQNRIKYQNKSTSNLYSVYIYASILLQTPNILSLHTCRYKPTPSHTCNLPYTCLPSSTHLSL